MSRKRMRTVGVVAAAAAMTLTIAACSANNAGTTGTSNNGGSTSGNSGNTKNAKPLVFAPCCSWDTSNFSYNPYNTTTIANAMHNWVYLPLAIQKYPSLTDYVPQIAESWKASGSTLTVNINPQAKWQDGTKVTSKDLYNTMMLQGLNGAAAWNDISGVKVVNDSTVAFTLRKNEPVALAENDILANTYVLPSSVYGKYVTKQVEKDVPAYFKVLNTNPDKAAKMPEAKRNGKAFQKMASFDPKKLLGNGPFKLDAATGAEAKLTKWDGFWMADKIKVPAMTFNNMSNQQIYPQLFAGALDFTNVYLSPPLLKKQQAAKGAKLALPPAFGFVLSFNNAKYPLNMTAVRQALAYVIPRDAMTAAAYGKDKGAGGVAQPLLTGLSPQKNETFLTQEQRAKLNPYKLDKAKATSLLKGAGFTQKGGQWYDPKGKRFTLTFEADSSTSDIVTSFTSATKALTAFGIKSDVNATSGAQKSADQANGNFEVGSNFVSGSTPLLELSAMLHDANFQTSGNYAGKKGMGFGPTEDVPGLGKVNVATKIYSQSRTVGPGKKMNELTWDWAQLVNKQVPYIWYATKVYQFSYSDSRYTNWPPQDADGSSAIWDMIGANTSGGLLYAMEQGYIQPK